ncbi:hypothetical protein MUK42_30465 [Musa troglodytarum]|uniref:Uncharacterized protein n=1 Tax=Musa troglodytarum TaxID=320322 RepID=A0A9E7FJ04_9LILI|nr:hypothetical protein MUK42_30465 [Musa troglodytarum]
MATPALFIPTVGNGFVRGSFPRFSSPLSAARILKPGRIYAKLGACITAIRVAKQEKQEAPEELTAGCQWCRWSGWRGEACQEEVHHQGRRTRPILADGR